MNVRSVAVNALGQIANDTDTFNKTIKTIVPALDFVKELLRSVPGADGVRAGLGLLRGQLNSAKTVINASSILGRGYEWADDKKRSEILQSWQKTASRVTLTVAQVLETVLFIDKCSVNYFSRPSLLLFKKLPIFEVVKNCLYMVSAIFSIWSSSSDLVGEADTRKQANTKKRKWENVNLGGDSRDEFAQKYETKLNGRSTASINNEVIALQREIRRLEDGSRLDENLKGQIDALNACKSDLETKKIEYKKVQRWEAYIDSIRVDNCKQLRDFKIQKYSIRLKNCSTTRKKAWHSITAEIFKIFMIIIGTTAIVLNVYYPVEMSTAVVELTLSALAFTSNSIGLTKNLFSSIGPKREQEPIFPITPR